MSKVTDIGTGRQWAPCNHKDVLRVELFIRQEAAYTDLSLKQINDIVSKYSPLAGSMPMRVLRHKILREIDGGKV